MNLETLRIQRESKLKEIGIALRKERERRKLTVNDVFIDCGIGKNTIGNIENFNPVNLNKLIDYCSYLGLEIEIKRKI